MLQRSYSRYSGSTSWEVHTIEPGGPKPGCDLDLVLRVRVGVEQTDGHDLGARCRKACREIIERGRIERRDLAPLEVEPARRRRTSGSDSTSGRWRRDEQVVELRPRLPADRKHVLESRGRDERDARALSLEHRVGRNRRSVGNRSGRCVVTRDARVPRRSAATGSDGVVLTLWTRTPSRSIRTKSVNVPPVSIPTRTVTTGF